jgi:NADP-dependent 3-hydroxy acid dehydrogenase YdfG
MTQGITDKVVVITGASSGLGEAAAWHLAQHAAKLVLAARRLDRLRALAEELSLGDDGVVQTDVTQHEQVRRLVDHAVRSHGRIDVIINNAGLMPQAPLERLKIDEWNRMIDVNIKGVLYGIAAALPQMKQQKAGHKLPNSVTEPDIAEKVRKTYERSLPIHSLGQLPSPSVSRRTWT